MANIIYVLKNEAMPDLLKIGRTDRDVLQRVRDLDNTSVPLPFQCLYAAEVNDAKFVEDRIHKTFADKRLRTNREFFRVALEQVIAAIELAQIREVTPQNDANNEISDQIALEKYNQLEARRERLTFKDLFIPTNAVLTFAKDENVQCIVLDENSNQVLFEGKAMSLSRAALIAVRSKGYNWISARGSDFWKYDGKTLTTIRLENEEQDSLI